MICLSLSVILMWQAGDSSLWLSPGSFASVPVSTALASDLIALEMVSEEQANYRVSAVWDGQTDETAIAQVARLSWTLQKQVMDKSLGDDAESEEADLNLDQQSIIAYPAAFAREVQLLELNDRLADHLGMPPSSLTLKAFKNLPELRKWAKKNEIKGCLAPQAIDLGIELGEVEQWTLRLDYILTRKARPSAEQERIFLRKWIVAQSQLSLAQRNLAKWLSDLGLNTKEADATAGIFLDSNQGFFTFAQPDNETPRCDPNPHDYAMTALPALSRKITLMKWVPDTEETQSP